MKNLSPAALNAFLRDHAEGICEDLQIRPADAPPCHTLLVEAEKVWLNARWPPVKMRRWFQWYDMADQLFGLWHIYNAIFCFRKLYSGASWGNAPTKIVVGGALRNAALRLRVGILLVVLKPIRKAYGLAATNSETNRFAARMWNLQSFVGEVIREVFSPSAFKKVCLGPTPPGDMSRDSLEVDVASDVADALLNGCIAAIRTFGRAYALFPTRIVMMLLAAGEREREKLAEELKKQWAAILFLEVFGTLPPYGEARVSSRILANMTVVREAFLILESSDFALSPAILAMSKDLNIGADTTRIVEDLHGKVKCGEYASQNRKVSHGRKMFRALRHFEVFGELDRMQGGAGANADVDWGTRRSEVAREVCQKAGLADVANIFNSRAEGVRSGRQGRMDLIARKKDWPYMSNANMQEGLRSINMVWQIFEKSGGVADGSVHDVVASMRQKLFSDEVASHAWYATCTAELLPEGEVISVAGVDGDEYLLVIAAGKFCAECLLLDVAEDGNFYVRDRGTSAGNLCAGSEQAVRQVAPGPDAMVMVHPTRTSHVLWGEAPRGCAIFRIPDGRPLALPWFLMRNSIVLSSVAIKSFCRSIRLSVPDPEASQKELARLIGTYFADTYGQQDLLEEALSMYNVRGAASGLGNARGRRDPEEAHGNQESSLPSSKKKRTRAKDDEPAGGPFASLIGEAYQVQTKSGEMWETSCAFSGLNSVGTCPKLGLGAGIWGRFISQSNRSQPLFSSLSVRDARWRLGGAARFQAI